MAPEMFRWARSHLATLRRTRPWAVVPVDRPRVEQPLREARTAGPEPEELPLVAPLPAAQPRVVTQLVVATPAALVALEPVALGLAERALVELAVSPIVVQRLLVVAVLVATQVMAGTRYQAKRSGTMVLELMPTQ